MMRYANFMTDQIQKMLKILVAHAHCQSTLIILSKAVHILNDPSPTVTITPSSYVYHYNQGLVSGNAWERRSQARYFCHPAFPGLKDRLFPWERSFPDQKDVFFSWERS